MGVDFTMNYCRVCGELTEYILCEECERKYAHTAPCKTCNSRYFGCHSHCAGYKIYRSALDSRKARHHAEQLADGVHREAVRKSWRTKPVNRTLILKSKKGR